MAGRRALQRALRSIAAGSIKRRAAGVARESYSHTRGTLGAPVPIFPRPPPALQGLASPAGPNYVNYPPLSERRHTPARANYTPGDAAARAGFLICDFRYSFAAAVSRGGGGFDLACVTSRPPGVYCASCLSAFFLRGPKFVRGLYADSSGSGTAIMNLAEGANAAFN